MDDKKATIMKNLAKDNTETTREVSRYRPLKRELKRKKNLVGTNV